MATSDATPRPVVLPNPQRLRLQNFSLYSRRSTVEIRFDREVFCLAGANGLGKTTFLSALTYAMTGTVARPNLTFLGAEDYYADLVEYSSRYFDGRIAPGDREIAEVEVQLTVGDWKLELSRGMFDPRGLRQLTAHGPDGTVNFSGPELSDSQRHERYAEIMCEATGLSTFAQLVFLQLIVLSFDEQRRLMFWSPRASEQALFLAFGISAEMASRAESLQRAFDQAESLARNIQWQATGRRRRLLALQEATAGGPEADESDLRQQHVELSEGLHQAGDALAEAEAARAEADVALDGLSAQLIEARQQYEGVYLEHVGASRSPHLHPVVDSALADNQCDVCGTEGPEIAASIRGALDESRCPLCGSPIAEVDPALIQAARQRLGVLSNHILELEEEERTATGEVNRRIEQVGEADARVRAMSRSLETFRQANSQALLHASGEEGLLEEASRGLQEEIADLLDQKDHQLARRDAARAALDELRDQLTARFAEMEHEFVPLLQGLAHEFLGVPLEVDLERRGAHVGLLLSFAGSERRSPEDLSESQRFFMDIALRMALARKLAREGDPATLYVDTPEGSLDIAYEIRAGRMFGRFALGASGRPNRLVMTANINTSQLLQQLASVCGRAHMDLVRMTEWTELSDVQLEAQAHFEAAYAAIEAELDGGPS